MKRLYIVFIACCLISVLFLTTGCPKKQTEICIRFVRNNLINRHYKNIYRKFDRDIKKHINKEMEILYQQKTVQRRLITEYGYSPRSLDHLSHARQFEGLLYFSEWPGNTAPLLGIIATNSLLAVEKNKNILAATFTGNYQVHFKYNCGKIIILDSPFDPVSVFLISNN